MQWKVIKRPTRAYHPKSKNISLNEFYDDFTSNCSLALRLNHFDTILQICSKELSETVDNLIVSKTQSIYDVLKNISPDITSIIPFAKFVSNIAHLQPIFTDQGLCFTFNALNSHDIFKDEYEIFATQN